MSLIKLIRRYLLVSVLIVLLLGCISHFLIFRFFIHYSSDEMLKDQKVKIENYIARNDTLPLAATLVLKPARIEVKKIENLQSFPAEIFKDTVMYSEETGTFTPYRQLYFTVSYKDEHHLININQPTVISDDLFYAIVSSLLILLLLFILFTYAIEYLLNRNIWKPLNYNLQKLHEYDLRANTVLELKNPGIKEFDEINNVILRMVGKINADYENSRLFTEDASHEMQTPLSIIKSKMDLLMQNSSLMQNEENEKNMKAISRATSRLSKLNKSLLLIAKINNNQYTEKKNIQLDKLLELYLTDLEELFETKELSINTDIQACCLYMNSDLADIMLSNLLSNAIRHNVVQGYIDIILNESQLIIRNTCKKTEEKTANLFNRITFHNKSEDSSGLGLNIVKSICDSNEFTIQYDYPEDDIFSINIRFC
ncbi:signal transduction histidine kinase [Parabacteroides sp. PF5-5]|uniref:sensor histidine kinase n=1 Tax=unclassified Parabacteroides TaxID=2649774 RepID=UPI00247373E5|nr:MULTISPECIES: HAMP domain-containing sensor histidine kinase [unclassified Parabacteroides]MDH6304929.1 signal transduction histidine kinase [Parabacteroides sp. PH5-39]MDH6315985.1 signal transduction histidine kinase [Parabacteroides sp. PF5-13]MDH6319642.1 signal transduction histidine kinase [Parabacteroides sp. PH5-13]MDH6323373.1 signal transduction histidine kinase [Parabacteroides sp. PH5-8]MDH6327118.1 signal transduction histidine kinase [Parabacteroides sp. PH5-41]